MSSTSTKGRSESVSFRLVPEFHKALVERASALNTSPGDCARRLVLDALTGGEIQGVRSELVMLRTEVERLRQALLQSEGLGEMTRLREDFGHFLGAFKLSVLALLVGGGHLDQEEARTWVNSNLGDRPSGG